MHKLDQRDHPMLDLDQYGLQEIFCGSCTFYRITIKCYCWINVENLTSRLKFDIVNKYYFDVVLNSTNKEAVFVKLVSTLLLSR